jgi:hypothetical protein
VPTEENSHSEWFPEWLFQIATALRSGGGFDLEQQTWDRKSRHAEQRHRWGALERPKAHPEQIKVLERLIHVGCKNTEPNDIAQAHIRSGQNGLEVIQHQTYLAAHIAKMLWGAGAIDGSLTRADQLARGVSDDLCLIVSEF